MVTEPKATREKREPAPDVNEAAFSIMKAVTEKTEAKERNQNQNQRSEEAGASPLFSCSRLDCLLDCNYYSTNRSKL